MRVDGNDVLAVLAVTRAALEHARSGAGPTLIEALTYRMGAHATSDDPSRYRPAREEAEWAGRDPIARLRALLVREELADETFFAEVEAEAAALATRVREGVRGMPDPDPLSILAHVYSEPHTLVEEERAELSAYLAGFTAER